MHAIKILKERRKGMKRINLFFVIAIFALGLTFILIEGCAKKQLVKESSEQPQNEMKQAAKPNVPAVQQVAAKPSQSATEQEAAQQTQKVMATSGLKDIHFDYDKASLRTGDRKILTANAKWLLKNTKYAVKIEGNCDERGTDEYNMALGQKRADTAKSYLIDMGVNKNKISTISYGKERPLDPEHNEEAWAKNRRDDFIISK
jgi:peptidoglycan-associated lipoprotein